MEINQLLAKLWEVVTLYGLKLLAAAAILILGRWASKFVRTLVEKMLHKSRVDETVGRFTANLVYIGTLAFVVVAALSQLGIQTTSFIAILGAAGLAIGLALQGSLSNFAAGFLMIIFKPFKVGDYIEGAGTVGTVEEIQIFTTTLKTPDNKTIIVPNSKLTADNIVNYSAKPTRRVDLVASIGYGDDIDKARQIIRSVLNGDGRVLDEPAPLVAVSKLAESSVDFVVRCWVSREDYWPVYFELIENLKKAFDANGVSIPFPQRDVHVYQHTQVDQVSAVLEEALTVQRAGKATN